MGAFLIALAIALATISIVGPSLPWVEAVLSRGRVYLDVPLSTMYTASAFANTTAKTSNGVSFTSGNVTCLENKTTHINRCGGKFASGLLYDWSVLDARLPVRFFMTPAPSVRDPRRSFDPHGYHATNGFTYYPAGPSRISTYGEGSVVPPPVSAYFNASQDGPDRSAVFVVKWAMDYTVRKMGVFQGLLPTSYLQVDYNFTVLGQGSVLPLPAANVSLPSPSDLWTPASPISSTPNTTWGIDGERLLSSFRVPPPPVSYSCNCPYFHYNSTPIALDAGAMGTISVRFTSYYFDSYATTYFLWDRAARFRASLDMRFGSVLLEHDSAGP